MLSAAGLTACGSSSTGSGVYVATPPTAPPTTNYGSLVDRSEFQTVSFALPPEVMSGVASSPAHPPLLQTTPPMTVLTNLPAVATQGAGLTPNVIGDPGTCEAQSFGYGLGSYTAARNPNGTIKWNPSNPVYQASAAWLFAEAVSHGQAQCPPGGLALEYLGRLVDVGCPSAAEVPYNPGGLTTPAQFCHYFSSIDLTQTFPDQTNFLLGSYRTLLSTGNTFSRSLLPVLRRFVASGYAIAFSGLVAPYYGLLQPPLANDVFYLLGTASGGHGQLIVGYDDGRGDPSDPGAFLVQNSFSPLWNPGDANDPGRNGRVWYSYSAWFATQSLVAIAYPVPPAPPAGSPLSPYPANAPAGTLSGAYNWYDPVGGANYLVLQLWFARALYNPLLTIVDAAGNTYTEFDSSTFRNGYLYVAAGRPFPTGTYTATIAATTGNNLAVNYTVTFGIVTP